MLQRLSFEKTQLYLLAAVTGAFIGGLSLIAPLLPLALLLAFLTLLILLRYPIVFCYITVVAIPLTAGVVRGKLVPLLRPNEALLILGLAFTVFMLLASKNLWDNLNKGKPVYLAFLLLAAGTIFIPFVYYRLQGRAISTEAIMDLIAPFKYLILFTTFLVIPTRTSHWHNIILGILIGSAIVSVVGFLQAAKVSFVLNLINTWYYSVHTDINIPGGGSRITSLIGAWNALGLLLMGAVAVGWAALRIPEMRKHRPLIIGSTLLSFLCLIVSGSFAGLGGLILAILVIEFLTSPLNQTIKRLAIALLLVSATFVVALPLIWEPLSSRLSQQFYEADHTLLPSTYVYRFWIWEDVFWPEIVKHPFFGTALEISQSYRWWFAESHYILLLFRYGVIGLISHLLWVLAMLVWTYREARRGDQLSRMMGITAFAFIIVLVITSYTNEVFGFTGIIDYLWILFALLANRSGVLVRANGDTALPAVPKRRLAIPQGAD